MMKAGDKVWNGYVFTQADCDAYNGYYSRFKAFEDAGLPVPEQVKNGLHNLFTAICNKKYA